MRLSHSLVLALAMTVAAPAVAQNTPEPAANSATAVNTADTNTGAAPINAITSAPAAPTTPGGETTALPPTSTTPAETGSAPIVGGKRGFPWGVLGLLGLIGLLGVRKARG